MNTDEQEQPRDRTEEVPKKQFTNMIVIPPWATPMGESTLHPDEKDVDGGVREV